MKAVERLTEILRTTPARLVDVSDEEASRNPDAGRWSKKQLLGHLIDSAGNNHQRFVRAQTERQTVFPTYEQESWVSVQSYGTEPWPDLVNLWLLYNRHLLHVIRQIPESAMDHPCAIGGQPAVPLQEVIDSYVDHLEHHLQHMELPG